MNLIGRVKGLFSGKKKEPAPAEPVQPEKIRRTCKACGKAFTVDPSWNFVPNFCKECKKKLQQEKEEQQKAGKPKQIRRKCRKCGKFFEFPSTLAKYPTYCSSCRKAHRAEMKGKYSKPVKEK